MNGGERRRSPDGADHGRWPQRADAARVTAVRVLAPGGRLYAEELLVDSVPPGVGVTTTSTAVGHHRAWQHPSGPLSRAVYLEVGNNAGVVVGGSATHGRTTGYRR